jgi:trigger factor
MSSDQDEPIADTETEASAPEGEGAYRLSQTVEIQNLGACKKHVRVRVPRSDLDHYYNDAVKELVFTAAVPGFRSGHVPRKLIERRFRKEVADKVKQQVLVESLEQLAEDNDLDAINEPNLRVDTLVIPDQGDFEFEFDVEVRPEFDLPDYGGLTINRPVRTISDEDVQKYQEKFLSQFGQLEVVDAPAAPGDYIATDVVFTHRGEVLRHVEDQSIRIRPVLRFQDAELQNFEQLMAGVRAGESRSADATVTLESSRLEMRGETVHVEFQVKSVKRLQLPELTSEFLATIGVESPDDLRDEIRKVLERQVTYEQRQSARTQVLEKITESADWDLPESLVMRQVENALRREILEMQQAGFTDQQIRARENELRQNSVTETRQALKEHFVLDRVAKEESIEVTPADIETEIYLMAMQRGESARRVRARLEKQGMLENLAAQILERKAIDVILERAVYNDVEMPTDDSDRIEAVAYGVCGFEAPPVPAVAEEG